MLSPMRSHHLSTPSALIRAARARLLRLKSVRACVPAPSFFTGQEGYGRRLSGSIADVERHGKSGDGPMRRFAPIFEPSSGNPSNHGSLYRIGSNAIPTRWRTACALLPFPLGCSIVLEEEQQAVKSCLREYATSYATAVRDANVM